MSTSFANSFFDRFFFFLFVPVGNSNCNLTSWSRLLVTWGRYIKGYFISQLCWNEGFVFSIKHGHLLNIVMWIHSINALKISLLNRMSIIYHFLSQMINEKRNNCAVSRMIYFDEWWYDCGPFSLLGILCQKYVMSVGSLFVIDQKCLF